MTVRILLTMSRSYKEWATVWRVLTTVHERHPDALLVHGNCDPGDVQAAGIWRQLGGKDDPQDADWPSCAPDCKPGHRKRRRNGDWYCPTAGLRRDAEMVESAPDMCVGFLDPQSRTKGAFRTIEMAEAAGIPTEPYILGEDS